MAQWDGNESSCACNCGFDIPKGGTLDHLTLKTPLSIESGGMGTSDPCAFRPVLGIYSGKSDGITNTLDSSHPVDIEIDFPVTFAEIPNVVVTPQTDKSAATSYGLFFYIKNITTSGCTVRMTTNVPDAKNIGTLYVQWIAVGTVST